MLGRSKYYAIVIAKKDRSSQMYIKRYTRSPTRAKYKEHVAYVIFFQELLDNPFCSNLTLGSKEVETR
jgi:hypothetical protein